MLHNHLKIAFRTLIKQRTYSFINLAGLAVGLATCMVITLYVLDDLSYDNHQPKADRIGLFQQFLNSSSSGSSFGELLKKQSGKRTGLRSTQSGGGAICDFYLYAGGHDRRHGSASVHVTQRFGLPA